MNGPWESKQKGSKEKKKRKPSGEADATRSVRRERGKNFQGTLRVIKREGSGEKRRFYDWAILRPARRKKKTATAAGKEGENQRAKKIKGKKEKAYELVAFRGNKTGPRKGGKRHPKISRNTEEDWPEGSEFKG